MIDFTAWVMRARQFLRTLAYLPGSIVLSDQVDQPADHHCQEWLNSDDCAATSEVRQFLRSASQDFAMNYDWTPPDHWNSRLSEFCPIAKMISGGAGLCNWYELNIYNHNWFRDFFTAPKDYLLTPSDFDAAKQPGGLLKIGVFDQEHRLSIEIGPSGEDRGVVHTFVSGAGPRHRLSLSFEQFLIDWENICYIRPHLENLQPWLDPTTGLLCPDPDKSRRLRALFADAITR